MTKNTEKFVLGFFILILIKITASENISASVSNIIRENSDEEASFYDYMVKFNKFYENEDEKQRRFDIFKQNMKKLKNSDCNPCGLTKFSDQLEQQVSRRRGFIPQEKVLTASRVEKQQVMLTASGSTLNETQTTTNSSTKQSQPPKTFDWRDYDVVTSIKDQQDCGNCWAFSTVAFFQSQLIRRDQADLKIDLSEQFLLQCDSKSFACNGGNLYSAMDLALSRGLPLEKAYPFSPKYWYPGICVVARGPTFPSSLRITDTSLTDNQVIKYLLQRPLNIGIKSKNWQNYAPTSTQRTFKCQQIKNGIAEYNHAVLLIGYTETQWIVKNQWGTDWGVDGYIYITRESKYNCGIGLEINTLNYKLEAVKEKEKKNTTSQDGDKNSTTTDGGKNTTTVDTNDTTTTTGDKDGTQDIPSSANNTDNNSTTNNNNTTNTTIDDDSITNTTTDQNQSMFNDTDIDIDDNSNNDTDDNQINNATDYDDKGEDDRGNQSDSDDKNKSDTQTHDEENSCCKCHSKKHHHNNKKNKNHDSQDATNVKQPSKRHIQNQQNSSYQISENGKQ